MLLLARRAVDAVLEARELVDPRGMGAVLAARIALHPAPRVAAAVGAKGVTARFVLEWDGADVAWWRALDAALVRAGGRGRAPSSLRSKSRSTPRAAVGLSMW